MQGGAGSPAPRQSSPGQRPLRAARPCSSALLVELRSRRSPTARWSAACYGQKLPDDVRGRLHGRHDFLEMARAPGPRFFSPSASSAYPRTTRRMLLKSWATPPASRSMESAGHPAESLGHARSALSDRAPAAQERPRSRMSAARTLSAPSSVSRTFRARDSGVKGLGRKWTLCTLSTEPKALIIRIPRHEEHVDAERHRGRIRVESSLPLIPGMTTSVSRSWMECPRLSAMARAADGTAASRTV